MRGAVATMLATWVLAFGFTLTTYTFSDDHFGRISPGRQIARYGELPFRDYFDPGYVLTELASATVQRLFGDNLLGEMLLTSSFVAAGAVVLLALVRRLTGSFVLAVVTAALAVLASPRAYDYDKFLFYPLGLLVCWRYADAPALPRLIVIALTAVVAGMFRYDNGIFVAVCGLVALAATHLREGALLVRRAGFLVVACVVCLAPYALFLQLNGGLREAFDQTVTYARREGARTRIGELPSGALSELQLSRMPPPPPDRVQVRWTADLGQDRAALETRYTLHGGRPLGPPGEQTWLYEIDDAGTANLRALVNDPRVADTHLIDRARFRLVPQEPALTRLRRHIPVLGELSLSLSQSGAAVWIYYAFVALSVAALGIALVSPLTQDRVVRPHLLSAAVMSLLIAAFVLREPVVARIAGACGAAAVLGAWAWHRAARYRIARSLVAALFVLVCTVATDWNSTWARFDGNARRMHWVLAEAARTPPSLMLMPNPREGGLVEYLRRCTRAEDRVLAGWFEPEVYFFSQRAFGGGMVVVFGDHWSEPDNQRRIIARMDERPPVVVLRNVEHGDMDAYPLVLDYLNRRFHSVGSSAFGDLDGNIYTILVRRDRAPSGTDPSSSLPCFADRT